MASPEDGFNLRGSDDDDTFLFSGGGTASALGGGGADTFVLRSALMSNDQADKVKIRDYDPHEDVVDLNGYAITSVRELNNRTQVFVGDEGDFVEFVGITDVDEIVFIDDTILV